MGTAVKVRILPAASPAGKLIVRLHPVGTKARGWGYEPETRAAIEWLEEHVRLGMSVCDVGTGTGILALVAARLGAVVTAYEEDEAVREIAAANIKLNELEIELRGKWPDGIVMYDLVVANLGKVDYGELDIFKSGTEVWTSG